MALDPAAKVHELLDSCATTFAENCRRNPASEVDARRRGDLHFGKGGLKPDEAQSFLRAYEAGLLDLDSDGRFAIRGPRSCSPNLHLVGRNGDAMAVHMEYLIHVGACGELILQHGWLPQDLSFECGELDIWGHRSHSDQVLLGVEAKARISGGDSLQSLLDSLKSKALDVIAPAPANHERKWRELTRLTAEKPVLLWLVADEARWLFRVDRNGASLMIRPIDKQPTPELALSL